MIESKIDEILAYLLHNSLDYKKNFKESLSKIDAIPIEKVPRAKKRDSISTSPYNRDYRQIATLFMSFLFRQFPELESLHWKNYFEYDDSFGYDIYSETVTVNERIHIKYRMNFYGADQEFDSILNDIKIDWSSYTEDFEAHWKSLNAAGMTQMDEDIQKKYGDYRTYFNYLQGCVTKAYLKEHHLEEPIRAVLILCNLLLELARSWYVGTNGLLYESFSPGVEIDLLEKYIPYAVSATREGVQFSMRS